MNPTARLATRNTAAGSSQRNATRAALTPAATRTSKGTGAPSAGLTRLRLGLTRLRLIAAVTATLAALLLAFSGSASATTGHSFADSFGGPGGADGQFNPAPRGVAVGLAGEVFTDSDSRIQRFDAGGVFQSVFSFEGFEVDESNSLAVDSALAGGVYVPGRNSTTGVPGVSKYSSAGAFEYILDEAGSETAINLGVVALDPSNGTVYTTATSTSESTPGAQVIDSFSQSTGALIASFNGESGSLDGGFICPSSLAVDPSHHVYVLDSCKGRVDKYSSAGVYEATVDNGSRGAPQAVATNPETGEVYVAESDPSGLQITNLSAGGTSFIDTFSAGNVGALSGLAVGPDGTVYTADSTHSVIDRFTPFEGPTVITEAPTEVQASTARLNGTVNAEGKATEYHYEYGLDSTYGSSTEPADAGSGNTANASPAAITGLVPNTTYHDRIVATNASGPIVGDDQTLRTVAVAPHLDGSPAFVSAITPSGARVHASVNPEHSLTSFRIEYGTTTAYGSTAPEGGAEVGEQSADTPVATTLSGLQPGTLYHYRVSAENGVEGPQLGADNTFITAPAAPATGTELRTKRATLSGTINPHGEATTYHFNYGPSAAYGANTPEVSGGSGEGEQTVTEHITGLSPSTTYHVQVVATTGGVSSSGADGTFTTPPSPSATVSDPTAVTTGSATLLGTANTFGLSGSYHFEVVSLDGSYSANTAKQALGAASGPQAISVSDTSLPAGQSFSVRLVVSSNESSGFSEQVSFATPALPPEGFPAPSSPASVYGCNAPHINPLNAKLTPGQSIAISGSDLGLAGSVLLGEESLTPTSWTSSGFTIQVPADAAGTLALTVNCGHASNAIAIATTKAAAGPSNAFSAAKGRVSGTTAAFKVSLPGPGKLQVSGAKTKVLTSTVAKAGTQTIKVKLSPAGVKALAKAKRRSLTVTVQLRFTPTGGQGASRTLSVTFKRKGAH